ncbi:MAG TPA: glycosyltransferase family 39 protein, partial [Candidatus Binataceae bacterium]|nr:glycosyltransferase family 39 protein [Candidatus Binataceae bacterium]
VVVATAILFFTRLGARALWSSEFRWAEIAREMIRSGNYFWPTINGHVYYDKPLGSYWLVLAATWVSGGMNELAARIPCVIAGLVAVILMIALARRLYDARTGVISGMILATSFSFVFFSRHASADVETITGELAAILLYVKFEETPGGWWVCWLWIVMAATSLTKGLLGFVLPILVIGLYATLGDGLPEFRQAISSGPLVARFRWILDRNRWLFNWKSAIAAPLGLAIYVAPFLISQHVEGSQRGLEMVYRENVVRFFQPFDHRGPVYLYLYVVFALMAPWSVFLPAGLIQVHTRRHQGLEQARSDRFALIFFWATFVFYTISGSRRSYYILPILPAAAVLIARLLLAARTSLARWARIFLDIGYWALAICVAGGLVLLVPPSILPVRDLALYPPAPDRVAFAAMWIVVLAAVAIAVRTFSARWILISSIAAAYASMIYIYIFAMPAVEKYRGEKPFALEVVSKLGEGVPKLGFFNTVGPLFYLDPPQPLPEFDSSDKLAKAVAENQIRWVIVRRRDLAELKMPAKILASEASYPWETDYNIRNKVVLADLTPGANR